MNTMKHMTPMIPKMVLQRKDLTDLEFYTMYLRLINAFLGASPEKELHASELKVLAYFLCLDHEVYRHKRFSSLAKSKVQQMAKEDKWSLSKVNIANKIYSTIKKGYLRRDEDGVVYFNELIMKGIESGLSDNELHIDLVMKLLPNEEK